MEPTNWAPGHCDALRECLARGMSFSEIANALNARFATAYTRNAAIGRARRMGLAGPKRPQRAPRLPPKSKSKSKLKSKSRHTPRRRRRQQVPQSDRPMQVFKRTKKTKLRCVDIAPRHLGLLDLVADDCRYPYGGDREGEAITFCGHPQREGSNYCTAHFHLTLGPGTAAERSADTVLLRLVEAA